MKAYIFDLDGTLLDSMGVWEQVDIDFLTGENIPVPLDYTDAIQAMSFLETALYTIGRFNLTYTPEALMAKWLGMVEHAYGNTVEMKPYAKEYLLKLRQAGVKLAAATSLSRRLCDIALTRHAIKDWFDVICTTEEVSYGKARPDIFRLAAEKLGAKPENCIVFEDILDAVKSAKSIGMTVYAVHDPAAEKSWPDICKTADKALMSFKDAPLPQEGER